MQITAIINIMKGLTFNIILTKFHYFISLFTAFKSNLSKLIFGEDIKECFNLILGLTHCFTFLSILNSNLLILKLQAQILFSFILMAIALNSIKSKKNLKKKYL